MSCRPPAPALPLFPPRLTRNEAEARSLLAQRVQRRELTLGGVAWELSIEPLAQGAHVGFGAGDWLVHAQWGGAPFELSLPASAADQWMRARFASLDLPKLPPPMRAAALEAALQDALAVLGGAGHGAARIESVDDAAAAGQPDLLHRCGLVLRCAGVSIWATLSTDALGLMLMAGLVAQWPDTFGPLARDDVPVLLRAQIGTTTLSRSQLQDLAVGDAIVLDDSWVDQQGQLWLRFGGWGLRVRAEGARLAVTEPFHSMDGAMKDEIQEPQDVGEDYLDEEMSELDALPVELQFDLGQKTMTLADVSRLQVGQVLDLERPLSQCVRIRVNQALIGTGELMEIGGRMAVNITALGRARRTED